MAIKRYKLDNRDLSISGELRKNKLILIFIATAAVRTAIYEQYLKY